MSLSTIGRPTVAASLLSAVPEQIVSPAVFYKMYEGTGTSFSDILGNGPALTIVATETTTNLWSVPAYATPDSTGNSLIPSPLSNAVLHNLFDLSRIGDGQLLLAWEFIFDGALTSNEHFFGYGADTNAATAGGWWVNMNSSNQIQFASRGVTAGSAITTSFTGFNAHTSPQGGNSVPNARISLLMDVRVANSLANINLYSNGNSVSGITDHNLLNGGTGLPGTQDVQPFCMWGRKNSTAGSAAANFTQKMGSAASNASMSLFFAMRRGTASETLPLLLNTEFYARRGDYPRALIGA